MTQNPLSADTFDFARSYAVVDKTGSALFENGDVNATFPLASVTKLLSAWSAIVAIERHIVELQTPAGPEGSTIRHLLAHTSGVPFDQGAPIARPGERRIYSNYGFELLGGAIAAHAGVSIGEWIAAEVLVPLGMTTTSVPGSPAYSGVSCVRDLEKFAAELLHPTLVSPLAASAARTVQFPGISGILPGYGRQENNDWGLGFEIRDHKDPHWTGDTFSPRTYGHFGQSGSFLWVDPSVSRAGIFLGDKKFGRKHVAVWPELTNCMRSL